MLKLTRMCIVLTAILLIGCNPPTYHAMRTSYYYPYSPYRTVINIYAPRAKIYKDYYVPDYAVGDHFERGLDGENWVFY